MKWPISETLKILQIYSKINLLNSEALTNTKLKPFDVLKGFIENLNKKHSIW